MKGGPARDVIVGASRSTALISWQAPVAAGKRLPESRPDGQHQPSAVYQYVDFPRAVPLGYKLAIEASGRGREREAVAAKGSADMAVGVIGEGTVSPAAFPDVRLTLAEIFA